MSFSFDENLSTDLDKVRLRIGDTDSEEVLLSNETITAMSRAMIRENVGYHDTPIPDFVMTG